MMHDSYDLQRLLWITARTFTILQVSLEEAVRQPRVIPSHEIINTLGWPDHGHTHMLLSFIPLLVCDMFVRCLRPLFCSAESHIQPYAIMHIAT